MKVITSVTIRTAKVDKRDGKEVKKFVELPPGEHDLEEGLANGLIARGQAITPEKAKKDVEADTGPSVTKAAAKK